MAETTVAVPYIVNRAWAITIGVIVLFLLLLALAFGVTGLLGFLMCKGKMNMDSVTISGDVNAAGNVTANQLRFKSGANMKSDSGGVLHFNNIPGFVFNGKIEINDNLHVVASTSAAGIATGGNIVADANINANQLQFNSGANIQSDSGGV